MRPRSLVPAALSRRSALRLGLAIASLAASLGCGDGLGFRGVDTGGGGGALPPAGGNSGLNAVGYVIAAPQPDGTVRTGVSLAVFVDEAAGVRWAGGVVDPRIVVGTTEVRLATTQQAGLFQTAQQPSAAVPFVAGAVYTFRWGIVDAEGIEYAHELSVTAPDQGPTVEIANWPFRATNEPIEFDLSGLSDGGTVRVIRLEPGEAELVMDPFAFGIDATELARTELTRIQGRNHTVPGTAFVEPGRYAVEFFGTRLAPAAAPGPGLAPLGPRSWAAAMVPTSAPVVLDIEWFP